MLVSTRTETHDYIYAGGTLLRDVITTTVDGSTTTVTLDFRYDENGSPYELLHTAGDTTTTYYYITNLQGDVMYLVDGAGTEVASYTYDPYGRILTATGELAEINPLRYRGYYYDGETGFYYLQSRYYDAEIGRFLNADSYLSTGQSFLGHNAFAYCGNNPVNRVDADGEAWETVIDILSLGYSALEVIENPKDGWAWAGFAGDLADVLIPFVCGIGEATRAVSAMAEVADVVDDIHDTSKKIDVIDGFVDTQKTLKSTTKTSRTSAVRKAWKNELNNVQSGGNGISRIWTVDEQIELLTTGKVKGYQGHHMKSVKGYPELAGDPNNVQFLTKKEHLLAHGGNWRNITHGRYID